MLVRDYMTRHPLMAVPELSILEAQRYMGENSIRHLPVVGDGKRLLGLVTRQALLVDPHSLGSLDIWEIARMLSELTVGDVMIKARDVVTVGEDATIEDAARTMVERRIGCLPVVEGPPPGIVVGIITETDLLAQLTAMMATRVGGVRVTVRIADKKGELARLVRAINAQGWGITTLGGAPAPRAPDRWDTVLKLRNVSKEEVVAALGQLEGDEVLDVREVSGR